MSFTTDEVEKLLKILIKQFDCLSDLILASNGIIGLTTENPPVIEPTGEDPVVLVNQAETKIWIWDGAAWIEFGGGGSLPYYELVATYSTDGTSDAHTLTVIQNTFPATTWTAENMGSGAIILHPSVSTYADAANNDKMILVGGSTFNLLTSANVYCGAVVGSSPATDGLLVIPIKGDTGGAAGTSDLTLAFLYQPLPIIIRYYF